MTNTSEPTRFEQLRQLAEQLHQVSTESDQAAQAYKTRYQAWLNDNPEIAELEAAKKASAKKKRELEQQARALLEQHAQENPGEQLDLACYTITTTERVALANEMETVSAIIARLPGLATMLLRVDLDQLNNVISDNPIIRDVLGADIVSVPSIKTTIHWSRLDNVKTPAEVRAEVEREVANLLDPLAATRPVILDTETTGISLTQDEPVSIAVIDGISGHTLFDSLVNPALATVSPEAEAVHGISAEQLANAPSFAEIADSLAKVLEGRTIIAYNAPFDSSLLTNAARNSKATFTVPDATKWVCAMRLYAKWRGEPGHTDYKWQKLTVAAEQVGIKVTDAHTALGDAKMTLGVLRALQARRYLQSRVAGGA
jgi:DNA polymerase III epsilon subunit-like protein